jgi:flagellar hook protein FlgE
VEESREQIINTHTLSANAAAFKTRDRMIGELLDMVG